MYARILALVDSTALRFKVAERAVRIASENNAVLRIGHVVDASPYIEAGLELSSISENIRRGFERDFEDLIRDASENGLIPMMDVNVVTGYMPHTLHEQLVHPFQPDLIVCGTRELSDLSYLVSGSVSAYLIRKANCDVLVVKDDAAKRAKTHLTSQLHGEVTCVS